MAGSTEEFEATLNSLLRLSAEYRASMQSVSQQCQELDAAEETLGGYTNLLLETASQVNALPTYGTCMERAMECYWKLAEETKMRVRNVDMNGDYPRFITGIDPKDSSLVLDFELTVPEGNKSLEISVHLDRDARITRIQVLESVLGELTDVSSEVSEFISDSIELQSLGRLTRALSQRYLA